MVHFCLTRAYSIVTNVGCMDARSYIDLLNTVLGLLLSTPFCACLHARSYSSGFAMRLVGC